VAIHPFDEWFAVNYPDPQPPGTRETALMAWNAAVHAAGDHLSLLKDEYTSASKYEQVAAVRDSIRALSSVVRTAE
jgi:hypothetical protein